MNPTDLLKLLLPVVFLGAAWAHGYHTKGEQVAAQEARDEAQAVKDARAKEQAANLKAKEISDELTQTRLDGSRAASDSAERMRKLSAQYIAANTALASCRDSGAPAVAVIRDQTRNDLERLTSDAEACRTRLASLQRWAKEVALPTCQPKETASVQSSN